MILAIVIVMWAHGVVVVVVGHLDVEISDSSAGGSKSEWMLVFGAPCARSQS